MIHGVIPALAEAGKIKIGGLGPERVSARGNKFRPPVKLDHFLITKTTRDAHGDLELDAPLMAALIKSHGDKDGKLRTIPITLHSDTIEEVFPTALACYTGKKLHCRGDGKTATRKEIVNSKYTGKTKEIACPCTYYTAPAKDGPVCKPHGTLHASIASGNLAVAGAVHRWRTTSIISIKQMIASLEQIMSITGTLRGVPLLLRVKAQQVTPNDGPVSTVHVCYVELRASDILKVQQHALEMAQNRKALGGDLAIGYRKVIRKPGEDEDDKEQAEVAAEFHNEEPSNIETPKSDDTLVMPRKQVVEAVKVEAPPPPSAAPASGLYRGPITGGHSAPTAKNPIYHIIGRDKDADHFTTFSKTAWELAKEIKAEGSDVVIQWTLNPEYGKQTDKGKLWRAAEFDQAKQEQVNEEM